MLRFPPPSLLPTQQPSDRVRRAQHKRVASAGPFVHPGWGKNPRRHGRRQGSLTELGVATCACGWESVGEMHDPSCVHTGPHAPWAGRQWGDRRQLRGDSAGALCFSSLRQSVRATAAPDDGTEWMLRTPTTCKLLAAERKHSYGEYRTSAALLRPVSIAGSG